MGYWHLGALILGLLLIGMSVFHVESPLEGISESSFNGIAQIITEGVVLGVILIFVYMIALAYIKASHAFSLPKIPHIISKQIIKKDSNEVVKEVISRLTKALYYSLLAFVSVIVGAIGGELVGYPEINYQLIFGIFLGIDSTLQLVRKEAHRGIR